MPGPLRRTQQLLARLTARWRGAEGPPAAAEPPPWARMGRGRRAHIRRVVELLARWAEEMDVPASERSRWLRAALLHDALRDARAPGRARRGPAAADLAAQAGEYDPGVLDAVRFHSVGYAGWDDVGKMFYLADLLEPGRKAGRRERAQLAKRVPRERDRVLREVVAQQMQARLDAGRPIDALTVEFWNSLV